MTDGRPTRREVLYGGVVLAGALAGCDGQGNTDAPTDETPGSETPGDGTPTGTDTAGTTPGGSLDDLTIQATEVAGGFVSPISVAAPAAGELLVVDQAGVIYHVVDGEVLDEPYLDLQDSIVDVSGYSEQGLLGIALHPEYSENGRIYVRYSAPSREGTPDDYSHTFVLAEFTADAESGVADPDSERTIMEIPQPQANHNAGPIAFGPDGYLYVPTGDGGRANDQGMGHVSDWYGAVDGGNGQDVTENLLGSMLRIDVDGQSTIRGEQRNYAIPQDNPLVGEEGLDEQYAWGLRNPFGVSFGPEGRGFVVDVGQNEFEELNVLERGGNYGWNVREGYQCFQPGGQAGECPSQTPDGEPLVDPIVAYPHSGAEVSGVAVIGGYLYDGDALPTLQGRYVFGDYRANGQVFVASEAAAGWDVQAVPVEGAYGSALLGIGRDANGELLVLTNETGQVTEETGVVARLGPA